MDVTALIADDSISFRTILRKSLEEIGVKIVAEVRDGEEAVNKTVRLKPDIVFLDLVMPKKDGMTALKEIMSIAPTKIIFMTSYDPDFNDIAVRALEFGAIEFILKNTNTNNFSKEIKNKLKFCLQASLPNQNKSTFNNSIGFKDKRKGKIKPKLIIIGSSTGGPKVLGEIFQELTPPQPPIIVVQHLPIGFSKSFAKRLNTKSELNIVLAEEDMEIKNNFVYLAPSGNHLVLKEHENDITFHLTKGERVNGVIPSLDPTILSASYHFGNRLFIIILTGMGVDGLAGSRYAKDRGSILAAQDKQSCVIYGMPKAIIEEELADYILNPIQITNLLKNTSTIGV
jgi:two-component system chemotaxis response regulator CheB